ncbi:PAPA-1-like conserved region-domain-containing protein [Zychaea mexicana]|uniref:PAPA-1-like conserved region-domain-containing protein n=1 Tax=Zychaea mexicana TaxID=64656 RepID=UPI0022FDEDA4|nr:PAPA-1-like conserved region-domain-containing protein [Zychaea mexicana]KAI9490445.1 PAPA-1-like conserved region-domain-containing protein [Zychaea mexicana]
MTLVQQERIKSGKKPVRSNQCLRGTYTRECANNSLFYGFRVENLVYEEPDSDDDEDEDDYEVVSNRPLTKRQRAKLENNTPEYFLELPMESGKKKHLTEEEQTLKRSEVARRRKNQSIQRAEKDKEDTINRLLKKQASKSRRIIKDDAGDEKESGSARRSALARDPNSLQYVSNAKGSFLSIPTTISVDQIFGPSYD